MHEHIHIRVLFGTDLEPPARHLHCLISPLPSGVFSGANRTRCGVLQWLPPHANGADGMKAFNRTRCIGPSPIETHRDLPVTNEEKYPGWLPSPPPG